MGYWGAGIYENDQAADIVGELVTAYTSEVDAALGEATTWDDLDAPLVFIDLLALLGGRARLPGVTSERVRGWAEAYLRIFDRGTATEPSSAFDGSRRRVVEDAFRRLRAARLAEE